jgi:hypothetical protein
MSLGGSACTRDRFQGRLQSCLTVVMVADVMEAVVVVTVTVTAMKNEKQKRVRAELPAPHQSVLDGERSSGC